MLFYRNDPLLEKLLLSECISQNKPRLAFMKYIAEYEVIAGDWAEFGVFRGGSARFFLQNLPADSTFHLFDSFKGLPETWGTIMKKGRFALPHHQIPTFDDPRCRLYKGLFQETLPIFVAQQTKPLAFVHIDCDLYSSTKEALFFCNPFIVSGTLLAFDEMYGYETWEEHEYRAYREWAIQFDREVSFVKRGKAQVAVRVER